MQKVQKKASQSLKIFLASELLSLWSFTFS